MTLELQKKEPEQVTLHWVPRYAKKFHKDWRDKSVVFFDADELAQFWSLKGTTNVGTLVTHPAIDFKKKNPGQKLLKVDVDAGSSFYKPVEQVNSDNTVVDWSLPLF